MVQISIQDNIVKRSTLIPIFVCSGDVARYVSTTNTHPCASSYATKVEGIPKIAKHLSLFFRFSLCFSAISCHRSAVLISGGAIRWFRLSAPPPAIIFSRLQRLWIDLKNRPKLVSVKRSERDEQSEDFGGFTCRLHHRLLSFHASDICGLI